MNNKNFEGSVGCPAAVQGTDCKLGLSFEKQQILSLLSASLYKGDVLGTATRELLQNSFDAVKSTINPKIQINWDSFNSTLTFTDNGVGMSYDMIRNIFFCVGGTFKEGLDVAERSGGFGIAKVQFFMSAKEIFVRSRRGNVLTTVKATQEELLSDQGAITSTPDIGDSFTEVTLKFPKQYVDVSGKTKELFLSKNSIRSVLRHPLIGYNINLECNIDYESIDLGTKMVHAYPWGTIEVYLPDSISGGYLEADVHCAGLYQFHFDKYLAQNEGMDVVFNVKPKYPAGHQYYPFANSRDDFSSFVKKDIEDLVKNLHEYSKLLYHKKLAAEYAEQEILEYVPVDGSLYKQEKIGKSTLPSFDNDALLKACGGSFELFMKLVAEALKRAETTKIIKEEGKKDSLRLINKAGIDTSDCREVFSKVATIIYDVVYNNVIRGLMRNKPSVVGITTDENCKGCFTCINGMYSLYLNPLGMYCDATHFATEMTEVLVHELGHTKENNHSDDFFQACGLFRRDMFAEDIYTDVYSKFVSIYMQYADVLNKYYPNTK